MTKRTKYSTLAFIFGFVAVFVLGFAMDAGAQDISQQQKQTSSGSSSGMKKPTPPNKQPVVRSNQKQQQQQAQTQGQEQSQANAQTNAQNVTTTAGGSGDQVSMNSSNFYALSLMQPMAVDCFTSVQGGAAGDNVSKGLSGFLGFYKLNLSCWMDKKADEEQDIHINAMLLCHDKHYRNALAYDVRDKGDARRELCIQRKEASGKAQMVAFTKKIEEVQQQNVETHKRMIEQVLVK